MDCSLDGFCTYFHDVINYLFIIIICGVGISAQISFLARLEIISGIEAFKRFVA